MLLPPTHTHTQRLNVCLSVTLTVTVSLLTALCLHPPTHAPSTGNIERRHSSSSASSSSLSSRPPSRLRPRLFSPPSPTSIFCVSFRVLLCFTSSFLPSCGAGALGRGRCSFIHSFSSSPVAPLPLAADPTVVQRLSSVLTQLTPHLSFVAVGGAGRRLQFTRLLFPPLTRLSSTPSPSFLSPPPRRPISTPHRPELSQYCPPARPHLVRVLRGQHHYRAGMNVT